MSKVISIEDVRLKALSVEIKALTVEGKQMTLSVFRQLPTMSILNDEFGPLGTPWGLVNYTWGEDKKIDSGDAVHLVWQKDDRLYRCLLVSKRSCLRQENHIWNDWLKQGLDGHKSTLEQMEKELVEKNYTMYLGSTERIIEGMNEIKKSRLIRLETALDTLWGLPQLFIAI